MKSKLLLTCTILFFCSSFLCGQNQSSKWQTLLKRIMDASGTRGKEKEWDIWETLLQIPTVMVTR